MVYLAGPLVDVGSNTTAVAIMVEQWTTSISVAIVND